MSRRPLPVLYDGKRYPSAAALAEAAGVSRAMICQVIASESKLFRGKPILRSAWVPDEAAEVPRDCASEKKPEGIPGKRSLLGKTITHGLGLVGRS